MKDNLKDVGIWGQWHYQYLEEAKPSVIGVMWLNGSLNAYLQQVDEQADEMCYRLVKQMAKDEGVGKNRTQRVVIYYRFVGYLEIPDEETRFSEDTRQGVSVEYISCAPIKVRYGDDGEETEEGG